MSFYFSFLHFFFTFNNLIEKKNVIFKTEFNFSYCQVNKDTISFFFLRNQTATQTDIHNILFPDLSVINPREFRHKKIMHNNSTIVHCTKMIYDRRQEHNYCFIN